MTQTAIQPRRRVAWPPGVGLAFTIVSFILFIASLTQYAFLLEDSQKNRSWAPSLLPLLIGWLGVLEYCFAWFANPMLLLAWILSFFPASRVVGLGFAVVATGLSLSVLVWRPDIWGDNDKAVILQYGAGYWLWVASIVTALIACAIPGPRAPTAENPATDSVSP